jgi:hypothetical protein
MMTFMSSLLVVAAPEIYAPSDEGSFDLVFFIEKHEKKEDGSQVLECVGQYKGEKVGFRVLLSSDWKKGSLGPNIPITTYQGVVTFQSQGEATDEFVRVLDVIYGTKLSPKASKETVKFTGISLSGEPQNLAKGDVKIKIFFESEKENEYAEAYLNIELSKKLVKLNEKDESYRAQLVKAFSK